MSDCDGLTPSLPHSHCDALCSFVCSFVRSRWRCCVVVLLCCCCCLVLLSVRWWSCDCCRYVAILGLSRWLSPCDCGALICVGIDSSGLCCRLVLYLLHGRWLDLCSVTDCKPPSTFNQHRRALPSSVLVGGRVKCIVMASVSTNSLRHTS